MAKNQAKKSRPKDEAAAAAKAEAAKKKAAEAAADKEVIFQVKTKRTSEVLLAFITFNYRIFHPNTSARLLIYGILVLLPGIFFFKDMFWKVFFIAVGLALILLAFFRQYISLWITKKNDPDYRSGAEFTYNFCENDADFFRNGEWFSKLERYKDITNFYYDDEFYYLAVKGRDFYVIPRKAFTVGDAADFEEFIYKKSKHTCRWIPNKFSDKMKKRRAERTIAAEKMSGR